MAMTASRTSSMMFMPASGLRRVGEVPVLDVRAVVQDRRFHCCGRHDRDLAHLKLPGPAVRYPECRSGRAPPALLSELFFKVSSARLPCAWRCVSFVALDLILRITFGGVMHAPHQAHDGGHIPR